MPVKPPVMWAVLCAVLSVDGVQPSAGNAALARKWRRFNSKSLD
jgi:hypothetical protein